MFEPELTAALDIAAQAGRLVADAYEQFTQIPDAPADIHTKADADSQELILKYLRRTFPADALCAEEETPTLKDVPHVGPRLWIIDPIDGSRGFARKTGEFSVMIAFVDQGQPALGVVLEPARNRLTYAVRGGGCWRRDGGEGPVRCRVSDTTELSACGLVQSRSRDPGVPSGQVEALKPARVIEVFSAGLKLVLVARGEGDVYVNRYLAFHDWDICAGHILVTEAGGTVTGLLGEEIRYNTEGAWQRSGLLASNGKLHAAAVEKMKKVGRK